MKRVGARMRSALRREAIESLANWRAGTRIYLVGKLQADQSTRESYMVDLEKAKQELEKKSSMLAQTLQQERKDRDNVDNALNGMESKLMGLQTACHKSRMSTSDKHALLSTVNEIVSKHIHGAKKSR